LWFGESFQYDQMSPANWLVEVSGIPFELMGDPRPVWKIRDEFGIVQSKMVGF